MLCIKESVKKDIVANVQVAYEMEEISFLQRIRE